MIGARFDDAGRGHSFHLVDPRSVIVADRLDEVRGAIDAASEAARSGSWVAGYVTYGAAGGFDPALAYPVDPPAPFVWFGVFDDAVVDGGPEPAPAPRSYSLSRWSPGITDTEYEEAFAAVVDHIRLGDTYQVNLTFPLTASFAGQAQHFYADLVASQRASYASHLWHDGTHLLSVSPEQFFRIADRRIVTRPMKGTRPRGRWSGEDDLLRVDLATSEKDRAENLMIVDLIRNDLGRVATFGTVNVDELFAIEQFPTVWQMTSVVSADLADATTLGDVFSALFPCGSVTGAPKAASMHIIGELERHHRGPYCGAIGFIPPGDGLDGASFNVAIRTAVVDTAEGIVTYGVGGGVTWDSDRTAEYEEAMDKARVLSAPQAVDGLLETIRWDEGFVLLDEHLRRLDESASYKAISVDIGSVREALEDLGSTLAAATRVRVCLGVDGELSFDVSPIEGRFATAPGPVTGVVELGVDFDAVDSTDPALYHKGLDRTRYDRRRQRRPDVFDVILTNEHGRITETTIANIAVLVGGTWVTPPIPEGLLPGVMRASLVEAGLLTEAPLTIPELVDAEAVAIVNSLRGWQPAVVVEKWARSE